MSNKPYKVLASNQITIQSVDDVALYQAVLTSSVGELINPSIEDITLTFNIYRDFEDVTSKFTKIIWKRYVYDFDVPVLDPQWGSDLDGKTEIQINSNDFFGKVKIECKAYDIITGEERMVGGAYIVLTDVNDLRPSPTPPSNPKEGEVWLDTSVDPPLLKIFLNGQWLTISDNKYIYEDIEQLLQDITIINGKVEDLNQEMGNFSLLNIDNKKDYLWSYSEHLTSSGGISPRLGYKCNQFLHYYKFKGCSYLTTYSGQNLLYDNINIDANNFTINMWISPGETLTEYNENSNQQQLITTGDFINSSMLTLWNHTPIGGSAGQNIRLVLEFGTDESGNRQYKELSHPDRFKKDNWYMITIVYKSETKTFDIYRNGEYWTSHTISKLNVVNYFGAIKSGWYTENLCILNNIALEYQDIKLIYSKNRPFKDLYEKIQKVPSVNNIQMTIV